MPETDIPVPNQLITIWGAPFLLEVTEDGVIASLDARYDPPADMTGFIGVTAHWVPDATNSPTVVNDCDYNGDPDAVGDGRHGALRVLVPQPLEGSITGRLYLTVRGASYKQALVLYGQPGASPSLPVTLHEYGTATTPGYPVITGHTFLPSPDPLTGKQMLHIGIQYTAPLTGNFHGVRIWQRVQGATYWNEIGFNPHAGGANGLADEAGSWWERPYASETWEIVIAPVTAYMYGGPDDVGPADCNKLTVVVAPPSTSDPLGVTDATIYGVGTGVNADGVAVWGCVLTFTNPSSDENWWCTRGTVQLVDDTGTPTTTWEGEEREFGFYDGPGRAVKVVIEGWRLPAATEQYRRFRIRLYGINQNMQATLQTQAFAGVNHYDVIPADNGGSMIISRFAPGSFGVGLLQSGGTLSAKLDGTKGLYTTAAGAIAVKNGPSALKFDGSGALIVDVDSADYSTASGKLTTVRVNLGKAANFNTGQLRINAGTGVLEIKAIAADLISLGTYNVGYGAGVPGQMACWGPTGLVAWIGTNGSAYGIAAQQAYFAYSGTDVSTAKVYIDGSGDVLIRDVSLSIYQGSTGSYLLLDPTNGMKATLDLGGGSNEYTDFAAVGCFTYCRLFSSGTEVFNSGMRTGYYGWYVQQRSYSGGIWRYTAYAKLDVPSSAKGTVTFEIWASFSSSAEYTKRHSIVAVDASNCYADFWSLRVSGTEIVTSSRIADFVSLKVGGTEVIASTRIANFPSLKVGGITVFDSSRNLTCEGISTGGGTKVGLGGGGTPYTVDVTTPSGAKTLWFYSGILYAVT